MVQAARTLAHENAPSNFSSRIIIIRLADCITERRKHKEAAGDKPRGLETAKAHIEGDIDIAGVQQRIQR